MLCIAVSYVVMIIAVAVSSGFRNEIRKGVAGISGDIQLTPPNLNVLDTSRPVRWDAAYLGKVKEVEGVRSVLPVIYRAGIIRENGDIHGVLFKGVDSVKDTVPFGISIPERLSRMSGLGTGDRMNAYFVGEKVRVRQFNITSVYDAPVEADGHLVVYADIDDLRRVEGWTAGQASAIEIILEDDHRTDEDVTAITQEVGSLVNAYSSDSDSPVVAVSVLSKYPQLFGWLDLIDFNVLFILVLMTIVAGFNMISGLLIMLFENISTIGLLKALGMTDRAISKVFLSSSAVLVLKGMLIGNAVAFGFCLFQEKTHLLKLDPANYFVSFVPVNLDMGAVVAADMMAFAVIMLLLLIPTLFIARVDPAQTVRLK